MGVINFLISKSIRTISNTQCTKERVEQNGLAGRPKIARSQFSGPVGKVIYNLPCTQRVRRMLLGATCALEAFLIDVFVVLLILVDIAKSKFSDVAPRRPRIYKHLSYLERLMTDKYMHAGLRWVPFWGLRPEGGSCART